VKAVVTTPVATGNVVLAEAPEPTSDSDKALIRVKAFSLNRGEIRRAATQDAGTMIGWDVVGAVEAPARNGSGPAKGTRVVGFSRRMQGWHRAATTDIAAIPDKVSDADAATLRSRASPRSMPSNAATATRLARAHHRRDGRCRLLRLPAGAPRGSVAVLRRKDQSALTKSLTVQEMVLSADGSGLDAVPKFRAIIDGVGGPALGHLLNRLDNDGRAILYGVSAGQETPFAIRDLMLPGDGRIAGFFLTRDIQIEKASKGLARLMTLLAESQLKTVVSIDGDWGTVGAAAAKLMAREFPGNAVLRLNAK
jgi:NADPH:quinone reductase